MRIVTNKDAAILQGIQKDVVRWRKNEGPQGTHPTDPATFQGALLGVVSSVDGIPAATSATQTGRGRIKLRKLWFRDNEVGTGTGRDMDVIGPDDQPVLWQGIDDEFTECDCYNISLTTSWDFGDVLAVLPLAGGRFLAMAAGGGTQLSHGIVVRQCDASCNTYVVKLIRRTMISDCTGTGTGTGT